MNLVNCKSALKILKSGLPVIFQTDTLPAIGCLPKFSKTIYELKKRGKNKPLILMASEYEHLVDFVHKSALRDFENIAEKYWPGALTMIIPVKNRETGILTSSDFTLGLRIPNSYMAQSLMSETGPLLTSSANISGLKGSITAEELFRFSLIDILGPIPWEKGSEKQVPLYFGRRVENGGLLEKEKYL